MREHRQLAQEERYQIYALNKAGHNQTEIAEQLGRHKSTISRELRRNRGLRGYRPAQAQKLADNRKQEKVRPRISDEVWQWVDLLMAEEWSPEQISGWLLSEALGCSGLIKTDTSIETLFTWRGNTNEQATQTLRTRI